MIPNAPILLLFLAYVGLVLSVLVLFALTQSRRHP